MWKATVLRRNAEALLPNRSSGSPAPDPGDRRALGGLADRREPVHVGEGAQQRVVVDALIARPRPDPRADDRRGDVVVLRAVVLVEGDDEEAVVRRRPAHVPGQMVASPPVAGGDPAVMHVVAEVGDDEGVGR